MAIVFPDGTQSDPALFEVGRNTMSGVTQRIVTGFPSNTRKITINLYGVGYSGSGSLLRLQIGDSGGMETSGYVGTYVYNGNGSTGGGTRTDGFAIWSITNGEHTSGHIELTNMEGTNEWVYSYKGAFEPFYTSTAGGRKQLSSTLTQVRLYVEGGNSFDQGTTSVFYETLG